MPTKVNETNIPVWRRVLYATTIVVTVLVVLEFGLFAFGFSTVQQRQDPFRGFSEHVSVFTKNDVRGVYTNDRPHTRETFNPQEFRVHKSENGFRVFCMGGSSAYGFPWGAPAAFPAVLEDLLTAEHPGRHVEVVNAAGVSYASHRLRILTRELVRYEPDVLIVYSGHNEFIEKSFFRSLRARTESMENVNRMLVRSRLYAALTAAVEAVGGTAEPSHELDLFVRRDRGEAIGEAERQELAEFFAENLRAICRLAAQHDVRVVLCTTPPNLREWKPARAEGHPLLPPETRERWHGLMAEAGVAYVEGRFDEALARVLEALKLAPEDAPTHYLAAKCHEALGDWAAARDSYGLACELDHALLRATDTINQMTRDVAAEQNVMLVDVEKYFESVSPYGLVGLNLIEDYVHPTRAGHEQIAILLWEKLRSESLPAQSKVEADQLASQVLAVHRAKATVTENTPTFLYNQGVLLANQERWLQAREKLEASLELAPEFAEARFHAGRACERLGDFPAALAHYDAAQRVDPRFTEARHNLGILLTRAGRFEEAATQLEAVVRLDPHHADAFNNLAVVRIHQGRLDEAMTCLEAALEAEPNHALARDNLGRLRNR